MYQEDVIKLVYVASTGFIKIKQFDQMIDVFLFCLGAIDYPEKPIGYIVGNFITILWYQT
jgi:hypothetical protein